MNVDILNSFFQTLPNAAAILDNDLRIVAYNNTFSTAFHTKQPLENMSIFSFFTINTSDSQQEFIQTALQKHQQWKGTIQFTDPTICNTTKTASFSILSNQHIAIILTNTVSTTPTIDPAPYSPYTQQQLLEILNAAGEGILVYNLDMRIMLANPEALSILNCSEKDILNRVVDTIIDIQHPSYQNTLSMCRSAVLNGTINHFQGYFLDFTSKMIPVESTVSPLYLNEAINGAVITFKDISKRIKNSDELKKFEALIQQTQSAVLITDLEGKIIFCNPAFSDITGYSIEETIGRNPSILKSNQHDEAFYHSLWSTILNGETWDGELTNLKKDGTKLHEHATIFPIRDTDENIQFFGAIKRDITNEKMLEQQLHQSQKMKAIGQLAGGIAHDFNNMLTAINGYAEFAQLSLDEKEKEALMSINGILKVSEKASNLVNQLLAFSRKQTIQPKLIRPTHLLEEMKKMLVRLVPETITLKFNVTDTSYPIMADQSQFDQILVNLLVNAKDAILMKNNPYELKITIDANFIKVLPEKTHQYKISEDLTMNSGKYFRLSIIDTGIGMTPETKTKVFEPFFTTKAHGKGTGLGLATVYGIIKQNNGYINIDSTENIGTTISIYWPCHTDLSSEKIEEKVSSPEHFTGNENVLVIEDDDNLRYVIQRSLKKMGYNVQIAINGKEALQILHKFNPDIILCDIIMPHMDGATFKKELQHTKHEKVPLLFMSGYSEEDGLIKNMFDGEFDLIQKPFSPSKLGETIRKIMSQQ